MTAGVATRTRWRRAAPAIDRDAERDFLCGLFLRAFLWRALIAGFIYAFDLRMFEGDNLRYEAEGWELASAWLGWGAQKTSAYASGFNIGVFFWVAIVYAVVGERIVAAPLILNWAVGAYCAVLVYHLARMMFTRRVAERAARLVAYLPMFAFWSALLYKEGMVLLFLLVGLHSILVLQKKTDPVRVVMLALCILGLHSFRGYLSYFMVLTAATGLLIGPARRMAQVMPRRLATLALLALVFAAARGPERLIDQFRAQVATSLLERMEVSRYDLAVSAKSGYGSADSIASVEGAIRYFPKGLAYLLFSPAPWQIGSMRQNIAIPETLFWYALVPWTLLGVRVAWRYRRSIAQPLLLLSLLMVLFYTLYIGNIGTAVRERAQIFAIWLVFASAGLELYRAQRSGAHRPLDFVLRR